MVKYTGDTVPHGVVIDISKRRQWIVETFERGHWHLVYYHYRSRGGFLRAMRPAAVTLNRAIALTKGTSSYRVRNVVTGEEFLSAVVT